MSREHSHLASGYGFMLHGPHEPGPMEARHAGCPNPPRDAVALDAYVHGCHHWPGGLDGVADNDDSETDDDGDAATED